MHNNLIFDIGDLVQIDFERQHYEAEIVGVGYNDEQWRVLRKLDGHVEIVNECFMTLLVPDSNG